MSSGADFNRDETRMARRDGAKLVKNSGRGEVKGDAVLHNLLIDYKFTDKKSFSIALDAFEKHARDAFRGSNKEAAVVIVFDAKHRLAVVDWNYLMELEAEVEELRFMREGLEK